MVPFLFFHTVVQSVLHLFYRTQRKRILVLVWNRFNPDPYHLTMFDGFPAEFDALISLLFNQFARQTNKLMRGTMPVTQYLCIVLVCTVKVYRFRLLEPVLSLTANWLLISCLPTFNLHRYEYYIVLLQSINRHPSHVGSLMPSAVLTIFSYVTIGFTKPV
jgi:hypothetical protein